MTEISEEFKKFTYNPIEKILLSLSIVFILLFLAMTFTNVSFRHFFFRTMSSELQAEPIGKIIEYRGSVTRQKYDEIEFNNVKMTDIVFPNDSIMTGAKSSVIIQLNNGERIEVSEKSLVKLDFNLDFSLANFIPKTIIESIPVLNTEKKHGLTVVAKSGSAVKVVQKNNETKLVLVEKPKKYLVPVVEPKTIVEPEPTPVAVIPTVTPTPVPTVSPTPVRVATQVMSSFPVNGEKINVTPADIQKGSSDVIVKFSLNQTESNLKLQLRKNNTEKLIKESELSKDKKDYAVAIGIKAPGEYIWSVVLDGKSIHDSKFIVNPEYKYLKSPIVEGGNNKLTSDKILKSFEGFKIKIQKFDNKFPTKVSVYSNDGKTRVSETNVNESSWVFGAGKIPDQIYKLKLEQKVQGGYVLYSDPTELKFEFLPPTPKSPAKKSSISQNQSGGSSKIFFTWTKMNFTEKYGFEIAKDIQFTKTIFKTVIKDNFISMNNPAVGEYFWRVSSISSNGTASNFSEPYDLSIQP